MMLSPLELFAGIILIVGTLYVLYRVVIEQIWR